MAAEMTMTMQREKLISPGMVFHLISVTKCQEMLGKTLTTYFQRLVALGGQFSGKYALVLRSIERLDQAISSGTCPVDPFQPLSTYDELALRYTPQVLPTYGAYVAQLAINTLPSELSPADFLALGAVDTFAFIELEPVEVALPRFNKLVEAVQLAFSFDPHGFSHSQAKLVVIFNTAFKATFEVGMPNETNLRALLASLKKCPTLLAIEAEINDALKNDLLQLQRVDPPAADAAPSTYAARGQHPPKHQKPGGHSKQHPGHGHDAQPKPPPPPPRPPSAPVHKSKQAPEPQLPKKDRRRDAPQPPPPPAPSDRSAAEKKSPAPIGLALQEVTKAITSAGERVEHYLCKVSIGDDRKDHIVLMLHNGSLIAIDVPMNSFQKHCLSVVQKHSKRYYEGRGHTFQSASVFDSLSRGDSAPALPDPAPAPASPTPSAVAPTGQNRAAAQAARDLQGQHRREAAATQQAFAATTPFPPPFPGPMGLIPGWNPLGPLGPMGPMPMLPPMGPLFFPGMPGTFPSGMPPGAGGGGSQP